MREYIISECNSIEEVRKGVESLDKAALVDLKIDDGGVIKDVEKYKGVYNHSKGKFCGAVVSHYTVVQHKDYFLSFAESMTRLGMDYKMTLKECGNRAFADIEFKGRDLKFDKLDEEFITGIRLSNGYAHNIGISVSPRFTRLACDNGMILTRSIKKISQKHIEVKIRNVNNFVETELNGLIKSYSELEKWVSMSMADSIEWITACKIMGKLFKQLKHREKILKELGISVIHVENKKTKKKNISYVWDDLQNKKKKFNRWELYNAITSYITHGEHISPHVEDLFHKSAERLLITPLSKMPKEEIVLTT